VRVQTGKFDVSGKSKRPGGAESLGPGAPTIRHDFRVRAIISGYPLKMSGGGATIIYIYLKSRGLRPHATLRVQLFTNYKYYIQILFPSKKKKKTIFLLILQNYATHKRQLTHE
jgi:hypothetical protein